MFRVRREEQARILGPVAWRYFFTHPVRELGLLAARCSYLFAPTKRDLIYLYGTGWAGEKPAWVVWFVYIWSAASAPILFLAAIEGWRRGAGHSAIGYALVLVFLGLSPYLISLGDARYVQPLQPLFAFVAGRAFARRETKPIPAYRTMVATIIAVALLANSAHDLAATNPAIRAVASPGGSRLRPPYIFAR